MLSGHKFIRRAVATLVACVAFSSLSCEDGTAPVGHASFALLPQFEGSVSGIVPLAKVRVVLTRASTNVVALDTVVDIAPGADSLGLAFNVPVFSQNEVFHVTMAFVSPAGDTVFRAGPIDATAATGAGSGTPAPVTLPVTYTGAGSSAKSVAIAVKSASALTGDTVQFSAVAKDSAGATLAGTPIAWITLDSGSASVPHITDGHVVAGLTRGTARIVATLLTGQHDTARLVVQPVPTTIVIDSGNAQTARVLRSLTNAVVARVAAADQIGVSGLYVHLTHSDAGGTLSADSLLTDSNGRVAIQWKLGPVAGADRLVARAQRLPADSAVATATAQPDVAAAIAILQGNSQSGVAGQQLPTALRVRVADSLNNPVPNQIVNFVVTAGGGSVFGGTNSTNALGIAQEVWTLGGLTTDSQRVEARAVDNTTGQPIVFAAFAAMAAPAAPKFVIVTPATPTLATIGATQQFVATVKDTFNNVIPNPTVGWTSSSPATATINAAGLATAVANGSTTITATAAPASGTATLSVGQVSTQLAFAVQPSAAVASVVIAPAVQVVAKDANGNLVATFTGNVTLAISTNPGGGTLGGTVTVAAVAGVATFANVTISAAGTGYQLQATATGMAAATSAAFNITASPLPQLAFTVQPSAATVGATITPAVVVTAKDAGGSVVTTFVGNVTIAISTNPGAGTLGGTATVAAVAGVATFANLSISAAGTGYQLSASATGVTAATSAAFDITAPVATHVVIWANAAGGNWTTGANWNTGVAPVATDTAIVSLNGTYTVTIVIPVTVGKLVLGGGTGVQTVSVQSGGTLTASDSVRVVATSGTLQLGSTGTSLAGNGVAVAFGTINWVGGVIAGSGILVVAPGGTLNVSTAGAQTLSARTVLNQGTITFASTASALVMNTGAAISNNLGGTIDLQGTLSVTTPGPSPAAIVNSGLVLRSSGAGAVTFGSNISFVNSSGGVLDVRAGTLNFAAAAFTNSVGGILQGTGTITAPAAFLNAGIMSPGVAGAGNLKITGGMSQITTSVLNMEVGGTLLTQVDRVDVSGTVVAAGTLTMTLLNAFTPTIGDLYPVLTFSARSGAFATINVPTVGGIILDTLWSQGHAIDTLYIRARSSAPSVLLALAPPGILGVGRSNPLNITLTAPAGAGGVTVNIASGSTSFVTVGAPGSVTIAQGQTAGQITLNGVAPGTSLITATAAGYQNGTLNVTASNNIISLPTTLNVAFGSTASIPVQLAAVAPAGGTVVTLTSNDGTLVGVTTPTVSISAGTPSANGTVSGVSPGSTLVIASAPGYIGDTTTVSTTASINLVQASLFLNQSFGLPTTVQLESNAIPVPAPSPGVAVTLTPRDPTCAAASPSPVTIPTGLVNITANITYGGSAVLPCTTFVIATSPNIATDSVQANVAVKPLITLNASNSVGSGLQAQNSGSLGASNHGGTTIHLVSSDPTKVLLSPNATTTGTATLDIPMALNTTSFSYFVQGLEGQTGSATISATAPGFTSPTPLTQTVLQPALDIIFLTTSTTSLSPNSTFQVRIGVANFPTNTFMQVEENIRFGGSNVTATITDTSTVVSQLVTTATTGASVTTPIVVGTARNPSTVATGGVELDPLAAGIQLVQATIPGFLSLPSASATVTVTAPVLTLNATSAVGSGLQIQGSGNLGASQHGGVTVHLVSSDPTKVLLAPNATTTGTTTLDIPIANGLTSFNYVVMGLEGVTGTPTISATAPGFTAPTPMTQTVLQPALDIIFLTTSTTSLSPNSTFQVRIGVANSPTNTFMQVEENIRFGGTNVTATITDTSAVVSQLVTTATTGVSVTTPIVVGTARNPSTVATGGVEFDPLAAGIQLVHATIPGFISLPSASATVTVTAPVLTLNATNAVGSGLQIAASGNLGASQHGGVTVHLVSSDPTKVLLAPNATTTGTSTLDIPMANGLTSFNYVVMGLEGVTGTPTISATAPGFTAPTPLTQTVLQPALDIIFLGTSFNTLAVNAPFQVRIGVANSPTNTFMQVEENVRFGGTASTATVTNSNASAAQLFTTGTTGQSVTATIAVGTARTPTPAVSGGVEFDPLGTGTTNVSATIPGFIALPSATVGVTLTAPVLTLNATNITGAGLQVQQSGSLGAGQHGGVTVHLVSSNPSVLLLAPDANTPGTASIDIPVANGFTSINYFTQGVEGASGTVTITGSASGFTDGTTSATVQQAAVDIIFLPTSILSTAANAVFFVRVGVSNSPTNTFMSIEESVRAGGTALTATVTNSNAAAAQLFTTPTTGQLVTLTIAVGQARSASALAFDPLAVGSTSVAATITGLIVLPTATQTVTIN